MPGLRLFRIAMGIVTFAFVTEGVAIAMHSRAPAWVLPVAAIGAFVSLLSQVVLAKACIAMIDINGSLLPILKNTPGDMTAALIMQQCGAEAVDLGRCALKMQPGDNQVKLNVIGALFSRMEFAEARALLATVDETRITKEQSPVYEDLKWRAQLKGRKPGLITWIMVAFLVGTLLFGFLRSLGMLGGKNDPLISFPVAMILGTLVSTICVCVATDRFARRLSPTLHHIAGILAGEGRWGELEALTLRSSTKPRRVPRLTLHRIRALIELKRPDEARKLLAALKRDRIPPAIQPVFDSLAERIRS